MFKKFPIYLTCLLVTAIMAGCTETANDIAPKIRSTIDYGALADELCLPVEQVRMLTPKEINMAKATWIIEQNTVLDGWNYIVNISEADAERLGVSTDNYQEVVSQLHNLTKLYYDGEGRGTCYPFDPQAYVKQRKENYKNAKNSPVEPISRVEYDNKIAGTLASSLWRRNSIETRAVRGCRYISAYCAYGQEIDPPVYFELEVTIESTTQIQRGSLKSNVGGTLIFKKTPINENNYIKIMFMSNAPFRNVPAICEWKQVTN